MRPWFTAVLLALPVLLAGSPVSAQTVTLNDFAASSVTTYADDVAGGFVTDPLFPAALPYFEVSSSVDGLASSRSTYELTNAGFYASFDHSRTSATFSNAYTDVGIFFRVDQNVDYVVSGSYSVADADGRRVTLSLGLVDFSADPPVNLFNSYQESQATPNESFSVGLSEGDSLNLDLGSSTGTLIAGRDYWFTFSTAIEAYPATTSAATATGSISLGLGPIACADGLDNDGDGFCDTAGSACTDGSTPGDVGCADANDLDERSPLLACDDGADNDNDGRTDFDPATLADPLGQAGSGDPGCRFPGWPLEDPACQDGIDNDGETGTDFDGGASVPGAPLDPDGADPQCNKPFAVSEKPRRCGLGFELALLVPVLMHARRWRRARRDGTRATSRASRRGSAPRRA